MAPNGLLRVKCHGCGKGGDALALIGAALGLSFVESLAWAGAGEQVPAKELATYEEPKYPWPSEVHGLLSASRRMTVAVARALQTRNLDPQKCSELVWSIDGRTSLPHWAAYHGKSWHATGHKLILPAYDCEGILRSVRAWRITPGDTPKRLPPAGCKASGLVLANRMALRVLRFAENQHRLTIVEGEPDFLTMCEERPTEAVIGIVSGSWEDGFARKISLCFRAIEIGTHNDEAGERYAKQIMDSIPPGARAVTRILPDGKDWSEDRAKKVDPDRS